MSAAVHRRASAWRARGRYGASTRGAYACAHAITSDATAGQGRGDGLHHRRSARRARAVRRRPARRGGKLGARRARRPGRRCASDAPCSAPPIASRRSARRDARRRAAARRPTRRSRSTSAGPSAPPASGVTLIDEQVRWRTSAGTRVAPAAERDPVLRRAGTSLVELLVALGLAAVVLAAATGEHAAPAARGALGRRARRGGVAGRPRRSPPARRARAARRRGGRRRARARRAIRRSSCAPSSPARSPAIRRRPSSRSLPTSDAAPPLGGIARAIAAGDTLWYHADSLGWRARAVVGASRVDERLSAPVCAERGHDAAHARRADSNVGGGTPLRVTRHERWVVYRASDGRWYLGLRDWNAATRALQCVAAGRRSIRARAALRRAHRLSLLRFARQRARARRHERGRHRARARDARCPPSPRRAPSIPCDATPPMPCCRVVACSSVARDARRASGAASRSSPCSALLALAAALVAGAFATATRRVARDALRARFASWRAKPRVERSGAPSPAGSAWTIRCRSARSCYGRHLSPPPSPLDSADVRLRVQRLSLTRLRHLGRRRRARGGAGARAASHARAARAAAVARQHDAARAATARAMAASRSCTDARCARHRAVTVLRVTAVTAARFCSCYLRPSPVVSSVPVTGRTVTMPDGRAGSRNSSSLQLWAGLRCSTPRLRDW